MPFGIFISLKHMGDSTRLRVLLFRLGPTLFAAPAAAVREIIPASRPTRIPGADRSVAGLVNIRGTLLTVVDGRRAVGLPVTRDHGESVLVLDEGGRALGLAVDEVLDLVDAAVDEAETGPEAEGLDRAIIRSAAAHGGRRFVVLDTGRLLAAAMG